MTSGDKCLTFIAFSGSLMRRCRLKTISVNIPLARSEPRPCQLTSGLLAMMV